jgi:hypothetical protein
MVWGVQSVFNQRFTTLFRKQKYEALVRLLCVNGLIEKHETVILVQSADRNASISVLNVIDLLSPPE